MDVHEVLYTTRAMRRVKPDPIPEEVQRRILDAAIRAPSGGDAQMWRFLLVDDPAVRARLGPIYRSCFKQLFESMYQSQARTAAANPDEPGSRKFRKMQSSAQWLADHFETYPLLLFAFSRFDRSGGSIYPAVWSAMLAARAEGVGSALTSVFGFELDAMLDVLGAPRDEGWSFNACVTMGYPTGRWGVAPRVPVHRVSYRNQWGTAVGFEIEEPLWQGQAADPAAP
ncbi:MAG: nitroreductase [Deltaproteobacteria bacterium]|jgi:nitroreductase|nr:nitroreductase [Deltaproteobacteria bacterium]